MSGAGRVSRRFTARASHSLRSYQYDSEERLEKVTTGTGVDAPSTQYAHNALGQRVFKTEPLFAAGSGGGSNSTTSGKNLNHLLADPEDQEAEQANKDKGIIQTAYEFFTRLWSPGSSDAQKLGFAYVYGQDGTLLGEYGMGGSNSSGTTQYIYLPTANGPMPIAAIVNGVAYAVHSDHLNTPRKLTQPDGQVAWQWAYSAFGDEQPTLGSKRFTNETTNPTTGSTPIPEVTFNLRYPGQYYDKESNLHYNYFRSYSAERGRYTQADPIGLDGGFNRFGYVEGNALAMTDPTGLYGVGGLIAGMGLNGAGQAGLFMYLGGLDWESAARCVDLNKVLISGLLGMVGPTLGDVIGGKASLGSAISMQVIGQMIKQTLPFKPFTPFGCECDAARDRIKKEWPKLFHLIENVGA